MIWQWLADWRSKRNCARDAKLEVEAIRRIKVRDYNGDLYIAYMGMPLVLLSDLASPDDWKHYIDKSRGVCKHFLKENS